MKLIFGNEIIWIWVVIILDIFSFIFDRVLVIFVVVRECVLYSVSKPVHHGVFLLFHDISSLIDPFSFFKVNNSFISFRDGFLLFDLQYHIMKFFILFNFKVVYFKLLLVFHFLNFCLALFNNFVDAFVLLDFHFLNENIHLLLVVIFKFSGLFFQFFF